MIDGVAAPLEIVAEQSGDVGVVFDDEDARHASILPDRSASFC